MPAWIGPVPTRPARRATNSPICLDARQLAAAAAGQDALFAAWQALASVALQDLTLRAQQLPQLDRLRAAEASGGVGAGLSAVSGRDAGNRAGRTQRCAPSAVHAEQWQGVGGELSPQLSRGSIRVTR